MKKIFTLLLVLVLVSSLVFAQAKPEVTSTAVKPEVTGQPLETGAPEGMGQPNMTGKPEDAGQPNMTGKPEGVGNPMAGNMTEPKGLSEALGRVTNEKAKAALEQNMMRFQETYQARLSHMEGVEVTGVDEETGAVQIKAKEQVKFLGFIKGTATKKININAEGQIEEKAPWYRFMYSEGQSE